MDREQEDLPFLGFFGLFKESFNIVFSWRRILSTITLILLFPFSVVVVGRHIQLCEPLFFEFMQDQLEALNYSSISHEDTGFYTKILEMLSKEWTTGFWFSIVFMFPFLLFTSIFSTAAVVYTIASIYASTAEDITFKRAQAFANKVWKRLLVTFLWSFAVVLVYNLVSRAALFLWLRFFGLNDRIGIAIFVVLMLLYLSGFVYITIIWQLATVVSVLEDVNGIKAIVKSKGLIKGKTGPAVAIFFTLAVFRIGVQLLYEHLYVREIIVSQNLGVIMVVPLIYLCGLILATVFLFGLVLQTLLYLVCKSYHHENMDKSSLANYLEVSLEDQEYLSFKAQDVRPTSKGEFDV
ncbi:hypothetical protein CJ030_MR6G010855 [Morella rubra]|uniref:Transmembrane protein n=1 Tax=Morella rubra TaxID=262757 RepID=A0A6A1VCJ4_9ROSI|nr:hypothetical protein CJ030_MR6G010855 [Morella rubra]